MNHDPNSLRLIELFYGAACERDMWPPVLDALSGLFRGDHASLFTNKESRFTAPFMAVTGLHGDDLTRYFSPRAARLWAPWQSASVPGKAISQLELITDRDFERTEIYNDIIKPTKGFYAGFVQQDLPDLSFHLALCRRRNAGPFAADELRTVQRLLPHLTNAFQIHQRLRVAIQSAPRQLTALLDALDEGAILADDFGQPLMINRRAAQILEEADGLWLGGNNLRAKSPALTQKLRDAMVATASSTAAIGRRLAIPRASDRLPLLLNMLPIGRLNASVAGMSSPRVVVLVRQADGPKEVDTQALGDTFRLTTREIEVASLLANGNSLETIAARLGLRLSSVRQVMKSIFAKVGVHSQAALVARVRNFD